jgi:hypothetical protein
MHGEVVESSCSGLRHTLANWVGSPRRVEVKKGLLNACSMQRRTEVQKVKALLDRDASMFVCG